MQICLVAVQKRGRKPPRSLNCSSAIQISEQFPLPVKRLRQHAQVRTLCAMGQELETGLPKYPGSTSLVSNSHLQPTPQHGAVIPRGCTLVEKAGPPRRGALSASRRIILELPPSNTNFSPWPFSPNVVAFDDRLGITLGFDDGERRVRRTLGKSCKPHGNVVLHEIHLFPRGEQAC